EGRGLAIGRSPARRLRNVAKPRPRGRRYSVRVPRRVVPQGTHRWTPGARASVGDVGRPWWWPARDPRSALGRRRERSELGRRDWQPHRATPATASARGGRRESWTTCGPADAVAGDGDSALYRTQAPQPAGEDASAPPGGADRGIPPDDLRRDGLGG